MNWLRESCSLLVLMYAVPAVLLTMKQVNGLDTCWNSVMRLLFTYKTWEFYSDWVVLIFHV